LVDTGSLSIGVRRRLNSFFASEFLAAGGPRVCDELDALDQLVELAGMPGVIAAPDYPNGSRRARDRFSRILSLSFFLA
jgi:hypothetical protein